MQALRTLAEITALLDRALAVYDRIDGDPAYSSWPTNYRTYVAKSSYGYTVGLEAGLAEGITYPPEPEPLLPHFYAPSGCLVYIADLLMRKPTKRNLRLLDLASVKADLLIIEYSHKRSLSLKETCVQQFIAARKRWRKEFPNEGTFPDLAVVTEVRIARRFGHTNRRSKRKTGYVALTYNQKKAKGISPTRRKGIYNG